MRERPNTGVRSNRLLGVLVVLASVSLVLGVASFALSRDVTADRIPTDEQAAGEGIGDVIEDSARAIDSASVAGSPDAVLDFITYETSIGRCFDVAVTYRGEEAGGGGCGGDGSSLLESGVGVTGLLIGQQRFIIISGLLDAMPEARFVEADLPSGDTVRMGIGSSGVFHWAWAMPGVGNLEQFVVVEFRALSNTGQILDVMSGPPLWGDTQPESDLPPEDAEHSHGEAGE